MIKVSLTNDRIGRIVEFCEDIEIVMDIKHEIRIIPIGVPYLNINEAGGLIVASFVAVGNWPTEESPVPYVLVCTDNEDFEEIKNSIVHELVHYEQWRDGRDFTERGVEVRTRNIIKKIESS
jgi:hypothetical protein